MASRSVQSRFASLLNRFLATKDCFQLPSHHIIPSSVSQPNTWRRSMPWGGPTRSWATASSSHTKDTPSTSISSSVDPFHEGLRTKTEQELLGLIAKNTRSSTPTTGGGSTPMAGEEEDEEDLADVSTVLSHYSGFTHHPGH